MATGTNTPLASDAKAEKVAQLKKAKIKQAKKLLAPEANAAMIAAYHQKNTGLESEEIGIMEALYAIEDWNSELKGNNPLQLTERMLLSQAIALNQIFTALANKSSRQEYMKNLETYMRLALKAQSQARATLETLANIKQPPHVVIAKQANLANNQQVNNSPMPDSKMVQGNAPASSVSDNNIIPTKAAKHAAAIQSV